MLEPDTDSQEDQQEELVEGLLQADADANDKCLFLQC